MELKSQVTNKVPIFEVSSNIICSISDLTFEVTDDLENLFLGEECLRIYDVMQVSHIDPGVPIKLQLYAENAKGTSEPAVIDDALSSQHKHYVEGDERIEDDDAMAKKIRMLTMTRRMMRTRMMTTMMTRRMVVVTQ